MRGLGGLEDRMSRSVLLVLVLSNAVLSAFGADHVDAARTHPFNEVAELKGSMARFREFVVHEKSSLQDLPQADEEKPGTDGVAHGQIPRLEVNEQQEQEGKILTEEKQTMPQPNSNTPEQQKEADRQTEENQDPSSNYEEYQEREEQKDYQQEKTNKENSSPNEVSDQMLDENPTEEKTDIQEEKQEEPYVYTFPEPYVFGPKISDWDEQRGNWLHANPHMKTTSDGKPRVLIVTGTQPGPCDSRTGDHFHIKSLKIKIDYARIHNYEIYYNFAWLDPLFGSFWVKLPTIRKLILTHPEIEWFFWVDSDAMFTDMLFEPPLESYEGSNMVMWGIEELFYSNKKWTDFNAGVFLIRNCQWTLDLIDKWSPMGPAGEVRWEWGKIQTAFLTDRGAWPSDDQSALAYLMLTDEAVMAKVKLVDSDQYMMSAWWVPVVGKYEGLMEKYHPGLGNHRWPWITHFCGCLPCTSEECMEQMERAYNFADNQVLAYMGFQHKSLNSSEVVRLWNETDRPLELLGVNPWEKRVAEVAAMEGGSMA